MTEEQKRIYEKGLWDMHVDGVYAECIAEYFFKLGLESKSK